MRQLIKDILCVLGTVSQAVLISIVCICIIFFLIFIVCGFVFVLLGTFLTMFEMLM